MPLMCLPDGSRGMVGCSPPARCVTRWPCPGSPCGPPGPDGQDYVAL